MIRSGITLLSWRNGSMKLTGSAVFLWYPIAASALAGATHVVRKVGLGRRSSSTCCGSGDGDFLVCRVDSDFVVRRKESGNLEDEPAVLLVVSRRGNNHQPRHGMHLLCAGFGQRFSGDPDRQHRSVLLTGVGGDVFARRRTGDREDCSQRRHDRGWGSAAYALEVTRANMC